jgi:hypothetical protein
VLEAQRRCVHQQPQSSRGRAGARWSWWPGLPPGRFLVLVYSWKAPASAWASSCRFEPSRPLMNCKRWGGKEEGEEGMSQGAEQAHFGG